MNNFENTVIFLIVFQKLVIFFSCRLVHYTSFSTVSHKINGLPLPFAINFAVPGTFLCEISPKELGRLPTVHIRCQKH